MLPASLLLLVVCSASLKPFGLRDPRAKRRHVWGWSASNAELGRSRLFQRACPDAVHDYWHFVVTPNSGAIVFEKITLHLGTKTKEVVGSQLIQNANQLDNVFVEVPAGFVVTDLVTSGSSADVSGGVTEQSLFNLGSVCVGTGFGSLAVNKVVTHPGANSIPSACSSTVRCKMSATTPKREALGLAS